MATMGYELGGKVEILHAAVEAFRKREVNFRDILEDLPAAIYTTDAQGRITYFNKACTEFSGRTPTLGEDRWCVTWKLFTPEGLPLPHAECPMALALREGRAIRDVEAIAERPDGSRIAFVPYPTPIFDEAGNLIGAVNMLVDVTGQKQAAARLALLAQEVDHRANNLLAVMHSLIRLTTAETLDDYKAALEGRFAALAKVNGLLAGSRWQSVDLRALVEEELRPFTEASTVVGEPIVVGPHGAQSVAMLIHELATNAVKYGALSAAGGSVRVEWTVDGEGTMLLRWTEAGGPKVTEPARCGVGNKVMNGVLRQLGGELFREWAPTGLVCTLLCKRSNLAP